MIVIFCSENPSFAIIFLVIHQGCKNMSFPNAHLTHTNGNDSSWVVECLPGFTTKEHGEKQSILCYEGIWIDYESCTGMSSIFEDVLRELFKVPGSSHLANQLSMFSKLLRIL